MQLLRANPSKGGDAELRDYSGSIRQVRRAASSIDTSILAAFFVKTAGMAGVTV
jgi:hypothetical protein